MEGIRIIPGIIGFMGNPGHRDSDLASRYNELLSRIMKNAAGESSIRIDTPFGIANALGRDPEKASKRGRAASNEQYSILIDGEFFSSDGSRQDLSWLLDRISTRGLSALDSLNGTYSLAVHNKPENIVYLGGDRYATRSLYYAVIGGVLYFSNDFRIILHLVPSGASVNHDAILDFINFEFVLNNETFHQSIKVLGHGERLVWDGSNLSSRRFWDYPTSLPSSPGADISEYLDGTFHVMRNAVKRRIEGKDSIGVTLSSGLDSRSIAACIADLRDEPVHCYHLGREGHDSSLWAAEICTRLNGEFKNVIYKDMEFERLLDSTYDLLAGQCSLNQTEIFWLLSSLGISETYILDGQVQDSLLQIQQFYPTASNSWEKPVNYPEEILKFDCFTPDDLLGHVLEGKWIDKAISARSRRIDDHFQGRTFEDKYALTRYFYFTARGQRYVWGSPVLESSLVDIGYPGMDYDLFDWGTSLPIELRGPDAGLYRKMLCSFYPEVATVPWDATGTPLNIYKGRKGANYSLTGKDFWIHLIRRLTAGRIDLSNLMHDQNMLFRKNGKFREAILAPVAVLDDDPDNPISRTGIEELTKMIMSGRNYIDLLRRALTVLNFFEHYYGKSRIL